MGQNDEASCQNNTKTSRKEEPSYALIDSQSVKTTCYGENHGYDGGKNEGKKTAHRNRYDGKSPVYSRPCSNIHDTKGSVYTFEKALYRYPTIQAGCADDGYRGTFRNTFDEFHNIRIDISMQIKEQKGFQVLPKRWVVERTFAWLTVVLRKNFCKFNNSDKKRYCGAA